MLDAPRVERLLGALALVVLSLVVASSVARPIFYWDSWAYHLPFSAQLWNIGDAAHAFVLSEEMRVRYDGFPLLAELLQGALWKLTGTINATTLVNSVGLAAFVVVAGKSLRASVPLLAFGALAVPLVALHATSNYIDLFVGTCVCFQVLAAVKLGSSAGERAHERHTRIGTWIVVYVAAAAAAGNAKITGLILSLAISGFVVVHLLWRRRDTRGGRAALVILAVVLGSVLAAGTTLKNAWRFSNPLYPFDVHAMGVHLEGPETPYRNYPDYTAALGVVSRPANWLLSITEADWKIRGVEPLYSLDLSVGDRPLRHGPARTGGYWGALIVATALLAIALAVCAARTNRVALRSHGYFLALFGYLSVVTAFMPQSHELRYYLHWPLLLMLVVGVLVTAAGLSAMARVALGAAYLCALIASQAMLPFPLRVWPLITQEESVSWQSSAAEIAHARQSGGVCLGPDYNSRQFGYASIFHGGQYVIEQGWSRCTRYPPYVAPAAAR